MSRTSILLSLAIGLLLVTAATFAVRATPPSGLALQDRVLLLRNGHVLEGKIVRDGQRYYVTLPHGEIRVKESDVLLVCKTLDECYHRRRLALPSSQIDVRGHLDLAEWCIDHGLLGYAVDQLMTAVQIDPKNPRINLVERRLELAQQQPETEKSDTPEESEHLTNSQIESLSDALPRGSVETFTNTIQPLLLNSCSTAQCHGVTSKAAFQLQRVPVGRTASRRLTLRNLHNTLAWLDRANPEKSPLLVRARQIHGGAKVPPLAEHEAQQWLRLTSWVASISAPQEIARPTSVHHQQGPLLQTMPGGASPFLPAPPDKNSAGTELPDPNGATSPGEPGKLPSSDSATGNKSSLLPKDEFDPRLFNLRFFPERVKQEAAAQANKFGSLLDLDASAETEGAKSSRLPDPDSTDQLQSATPEPIPPVTLPIPKPPK